MFLMITTGYVKLLQPSSKHSLVAKWPAQREDMHLCICNPYDIKFNNGYYLLISYIIRVSSRLLIGLVLTAIVFLDSKISNINTFQYQYSTGADDGRLAVRRLCTTFLTPE